jgi:outer membrane lipoprotein-sorting protein
MNKNFFLIILLFASCSLSAQSTPPQAASVMGKTVQKYNALSAFSFHFSVNVEDNKKQTKNFTGVLWVKKDKYLLTFEDQIIANDGKMAWNFQKNSNEASIFDVDEDDFSIYNPAQLLNNWNNEYDAKVIREEELQKKQVILVDLSPKKKSSFYKIRLFIEKTTSYIQKMMMYEMDGTTITYTITTFTPNATIEDHKFTFNKNDYPDVQINDMR